MSFKLANKFFQSGDFQQALQEYSKIAETHPLYNQAQFNISLINKKLGSPVVLKNNKNISHNPLVSVVMPVFNVAPYLDASIISVLNQSYQNIELVIVNDASTDDGMNIIRMYEAQDPRIKVINLEFNTLGGAGIPSNVGVNNAIGEYIAYADSDDMLNKYAIEKMVETALENDAEVIIGDFCTFDNHNRVMELAYDKDRWSELPVDEVFNPKEHSRILKISPVPWRKLYKRSFLEQHKIRFPEGDYFYEDNPLHWFTLICANRAVLIDEEIAYHRMAREGQTMGADTYKLAAHFCHMNSVYKFLKESAEKNNKKVWMELIRKVFRYDWVHNKEENPKIARVLRKRNGIVIKKILEASGVSSKDFFDKNPKNKLKFDEYYNAEKDIDLTIIIPVYNCADLLQSTLNDLLEFKLISVQILLMDDGSSDESRVICDHFASQYDNVISISQNNKGAGVARNALIPLAIGDYTFFLDADDTINIQELEKIVLFSKQNNYDLTLFKYRIHFYEKNTFKNMFDSDAKIWDKMLGESSQKKIKTLSSGLINYPWNRLIKTDLLHDENIFFGKTVVHNDVPYHWHSIVSANNIGLYDGFVCDHRKFEEREQITNINDVRRMMVFEAYRHTNSTISKYNDFTCVYEKWKEFITKLLVWAKDRVPDELQERYASNQEIVLNDLESFSAEDPNFNNNKKVGFYRIIGNSVGDLHDSNQALNNLNFILQNESTYENVDRIFVLNRITNSDLKDRLIDTFERNNCRYIDIPFVEEIFKQSGYDFNAMPDDYFWFTKKKNWTNIVSMTAIRNRKNMYLMNNNGARNFSIIHGKEDYDWVMPWDGNCFMPKKNFIQLLKEMNQDSKYKYISTPMERLVDNTVNDNSVVENAIEEPQISLRKDASELFNEYRVYGNKSKVELFMRLGYSGVWDKLVNLYPWEKLEYKESPEKNLFTVKSGVFRLSSGNTKAAVDGDNRSHTRSYGIINSIDTAEAIYVKKNFNNESKRKQLFTILEQTVKFDDYEKKFSSVFIDEAEDINKINSHDRINVLLYGLRNGLLTTKNVLDINLDKIMYKDNVDLKNVNVFIGTLNNLTTILISNLVKSNFKEAVKTKLNLAMVFYFYYQNKETLGFEGNKKLPVISKVIHDIFNIIFEYDCIKDIQRAQEEAK